MSAPAPPIDRCTADVAGVDVIRPPRERLDAHHRAHARAFGSRYEQTTFGDRKAHFTGVPRVDPALIRLRGPAWATA